MGTKQTLEVWCDKCGKRVPDGESLDSWWQLTFEQDFSRKFRVDLCPTCGPELNSMMTHREDE